MFMRSMVSRLDERVAGVGVGIALLACVGCGDDNDSGPAATLTPTPTRTAAVPNRAGFTATPRGTALRTATPTPGGSNLPTSTPGGTNLPTPSATTTPPTTSGTETVTPTVSVVPTRTLPLEPHAVLSIGRVSGELGAIVSVDVTLSEVDQGVDISATQNDFSFDPDAIQVVENTKGDPDCAVNPAIDKENTAFSFQPPGCGDASARCTGVRAIVVSFTNTDPIVPGALLYTCNVAILAAAAPGVVYPLHCAQALASSPEGNAIEVECDDGEIEVEGSPPGPTPTPASFVPTPTPTPVACITQTPGSCGGL